MLKVLLVDDHNLYRQGIKDMLAQDSEIEVAGEANNGQDALKMIRDNGYEVIVLDITMPDMDGIEVLKQLQNSALNVRVLILSIHPEELYLHRVFQFGAAGYLTKSRAPRELISAIKAVASGRKYTSPDMDVSLKCNQEA